jgi:hypothetical protein
MLTASRQPEVRSAGKGSKGSRWYAWSWLATASPRYHLLIRHHLKTGELAFRYCFVPDDQLLTLTRLIRAAGLRWPVDEEFRLGKDCFGLDQARSGSTPRSPATPSWSWLPWPSASSPCRAAPPHRQPAAPAGPP